MSRRLALALLILALALSACMPGLAPISAADSQATAIALAGTFAAHTLAAMPSSTPLPTDTPVPTSTPVIAPSATDTPTETATSAPDTTGTTVSTASATATGSLAASPTATATMGATPTLGPLIHGTMPPAVPFGYVTLLNQSGKVAYIAFRCALANSNLTTVAEYPVFGTHKITLPAGHCLWRAWVRGQEFSGEVRIKQNVEYMFIFRQKRIIVSP